MRSSLGLSLGAATLIAVTDGRATVRRQALTLPSGLAVTGFVERIGDPVPMVLADGSIHRPETLTAAAVEELTQTVRPQRRPDVAAVAVPAHWPDTVVAAFRAAVPHLTVVSDAAAALTALQASPGLPAHGVIALCDFGAGGTGITLADASAGLTSIGTVRVDAFSGDAVDRALLQHVLAQFEAEPGGTAHVATLAGLREQCRVAKERLSSETATSLAYGHTTVRVTRAELDGLITADLNLVADALLGMLDRYGITPAQLAAVATVGGGARIPLVTQRLSEVLRQPVITAPGAQVAAAAGAELLALRSADHDAPTVLASAPPTADVWAPPTAANATVAAPVTPLAWSAEPDGDETGYATEYARPDVHFQPDESDEPDLEPLAWYRRPGVLFAAAACFAAVAATGLVLTAHTGPVEADTSTIATPVATKPAQAPADTAPAVEPPPAVTEVVVADAPAPRVVPPAAPAPQQPVLKQAAPQPVPRPVPQALPQPVPQTVLIPVPIAPPPPPAPSTVTVTPKPTPSPTPTPSPSPKPTPTSTPAPSPEPTSSPEPSPEPTSSPTPSPEPTTSPEPTSSPAPSLEPTQEPEPAPTSTETAAPAAPSEPQECAPESESDC
ncbi:Hsp70 family protein [Mycolicibacterium parafortuitum]|uniref:Molecular chaperone n=1 Tax=Mycolicibacterium parafortuitum TaxID=39692 RepID=A0A375YF29_MYCPF|nr:Hsp70 family protein [Mycolicibacterium parafortuitum]ORB31500.1 hypothetical protein BST38_05845 [Mycolicibacterium parafortuitum]SRX79735.1 hypothetical protein MPP7335_01473 [Mycolicibacterium parafortuitum]